MQKRKFDELISHFNRKVSDMSIDQKYKMELLGMISAIGFAHEKELGTNLASLGTDCISREQAIDIAKDLTITVEGYEMHNQAVMNYCADIMQLPPIQPKKGRWIKNETTWTGYKCSVCGDVPYMHTCMGKPMYSYCPYCGSDMREVNHESD